MNEGHSIKAQINSLARPDQINPAKSIGKIGAGQTAAEDFAEIMRKLTPADTNSSAPADTASVSTNASLQDTKNHSSAADLASGESTESEDPDEIVGDIDGNGIVDSDDLGILLALWGTDSAKADLNSDGTVDIQDLNTLLANFGQPEPEKDLIPGDVDGDGIVGEADLKHLLDLFGSKSERADFNGDNIVDVNDLNILLSNWTMPNSPAEPNENEQPEGIPSDLTGDGVVDINDLKTLLNLMGTNSNKGDINGDGEVNFFDISELLNNLTPKQ